MTIGRRRRRRRGRAPSAPRSEHRAERTPLERPDAAPFGIPAAPSAPSMPQLYDGADIDVPTTDEYFDDLLEQWGDVDLAGASAKLDDGGFGAVFIGATPSGRIIGRAVSGTREGAEREALELVRDGALETAESNPVVRAATKGLRLVLRRRAGNRRPRQVEDDEALDLVGLASWAEELRCRPSR